MILRQDADTIVYGAAFAAQKSENGEVVRVDPPEIAISNAKSIISKVIRVLKPISYKLYLTAAGDSTNFRLHYGKNYGFKHIGYKEHRKYMDKPVHYEVIRDYLMKNYECSLAIGEEADDRIGIDHMNSIDKGSIISSQDKDLNNIPGMHFNYIKEIEYYVTEEEALKNFYSQLLEGDRADNVPGLKGKGPVFARKLLGPLSTEISMFNAVRELYNDDERLLNIGRCLWIRRKEGELWEFPT